MRQKTAIYCAFSRGQSLIEILVVTGIIAIVLGFLIPAMFLLIKAVNSLKGR